MARVRQILAYAQGIYFESTLFKSMKMDEQVLEVALWMTFIIHMPKLNGFSKVLPNLLHYYAFDNDVKS